MRNLGSTKIQAGWKPDPPGSNFENMKIYTILWGPQFKSQGLPEPKSQRYPLGPSCKNQETRRAHGFCLGEAASCSKAEGEVRVMPTREEKKGKKKMTPCRVGGVDFHPRENAGHQTFSRSDGCPSG